MIVFLPFNSFSIFLPLLPLSSPPPYIKQLLTCLTWVQMEPKPGRWWSIRVFSFHPAALELFVGKAALLQLTLLSTKQKLGMIYLSPPGSITACVLDRQLYTRPVRKDTSLWTKGAGDHICSDALVTPTLKGLSFLQQQG